MRKVLNVAPVQVHTLLIGLADFVRDLLDRDDRFTRNLAGVRAAGRIEASLCCEEYSGVLDEQDWILLREACETPSAGYLSLVTRGPDGNPVGAPIRITRALLPFIEAVVSAEPVNGLGREKNQESRPT